MRFENHAIDQLSAAYEEECSQLFEIFNEAAERKLSVESRHSQQALRKLAGLTFKLSTREVSQSKVKQLEEQAEYSKEVVDRLRQERDRLRERVSSEFQGEEEAYLRRIKEANVELLRVSKLKNECEKRVREGRIE